MSSCRVLHSYTKTGSMVSMLFVDRMKSDPEHISRGVAQLASAQRSGR